MSDEGNTAGNAAPATATGAAGTGGQPDYKAIAEAAQKRGAEVTVIAGITSVDPPGHIRVLRVTTAEEMFVAVTNELSKASVFIGAAAVADYAPAHRAANKIKKAKSSLVITLEPTRDILAEVAASKRDGLLVIGFAAETENVLRNARKKLNTKNLDAIVANDVTRSDAGFDSPTNQIAIVTNDNQNPVELPLMPKIDAAHRILDELVRLRQKWALSSGAAVLSEVRRA